MKISTIIGFWLTSHPPLSGRAFHHKPFRIMKTFLTAMALSALPLLSSADTIHVERVQMNGPVKMMMPFETDSVNMKGDKFEIKKCLDANIAWIFQKPTGSRQRGEALLPANYNSDVSALTTLFFTLETQRYAKVKVDIKNLHEYKMFVNEKEHSGSDITLTPGRTSISLLALTDTTQHDSIHIDIIGDLAAQVQVNPTGKRPYTMGEMLWGDHPYLVRISPTGKYCYSVYYNMKKDGSAVYRTLVTETATGRTLMRRSGYVDYKWMPKRDALYFTRAGVEGNDLVVFQPATGEETVLAQNIPSTQFTLSPNEDYFIYNKTQEGKTETNGLRRLYDPDDRQPGWRNRSTVWMYDLKNGINRQLTHGEASVWLSDISEDGQNLLLSYGRMRPNRSPFHSTSLVRMNVYSGKVDTLLNDTVFIDGAQFSPDSKMLLVKASPAAFNGIGCEVLEGQIPQGFDNRLYLYDIEKQSVTPLLPHFAPSVNRSQWSPTDGFIYFSANDGCDVGLFRLDPVTKEVFRYQLPVNCVSGYSIALRQKKPTAVFFGQTGERARQSYVCRLNAIRPDAKPSGDIDAEAIYKDLAIGQCQDWSFQSSRGDTIHGFYFLPPDFDASKQYPLIVYYYGGCTPTTKCLEFQYPLQVLASQGYVVYACNPSGAIGYGQEFAARHVNTWGEGSADDIIEGTRQFLKEHPFVNPKKIGCMGASYGGFMTQYLQTRTDLFAAAISHAGISNIASYWGGGYWGYTYGETAQFGSYPWNNPDLYVKHSPLFNADKIHTPLLLLHGTADTNVPTNESQQLFTALRILGRPVSYIQVEGQDHVITDYNKRWVWQNAIFAWFAHWLKDQPEWWDDLYPEDKAHWNK